MRVAASSPTAGQTLAQLIEQPMTYISGLNNTGSQTKTFTAFVRPWQMLGISRLEYMANTSLYSSVISGSPPGIATDGCVMDVFSVNEDPLSLASKVDVSVKIVYYVQLYDRLTLVSSVL